MTYQFRIASPCSADWNEMKGDGHIRHCEQCNLNVYNFAALTAPEIDSLVAHREGRLCARLYQRTDGTVLTKNCPVGFRAAILRASGFATAALGAFLTVVSASSAQTTQKKETAAQTQSAPATLLLEVTDAVGAVIPNVQVTIRNESNGAVLTLKTDTDGRARLADLPKSTYEISLAAPGFLTKKLTHVSAPDPALKRVPLEVGQTNMGVIVIVGEVAPEHRNPIKSIFSKLRHLV